MPMRSSNIGATMLSVSRKTRVAGVEVGILPQLPQITMAALPIGL